MATRNRGKLAEARALLRAAGIADVVSIAELEAGGIVVGEIVETGRTFAANALIKARAVVAASGLAAVGDDSGLIVDALDGAPGVRSSRYAADAGVGAEGDTEANMALLLERLRPVPPNERSARFVCVAALAFPDDRAPIVATGTCEGLITDQRAGTGGFGYDPVFFLPELGVTMAELEAGEKNMISHRAAALAALVKRLGS